MSESLLPVSEIFGPTLQGEGAHAGRAAMFIRLAGCDSRCPWCDTKYAWEPEGVCHMSETEIIDALQRLGPGCRLVVITGGNPALHDLSCLVSRLRALTYEIHAETQGTVFQKWFVGADLVTVSPKAGLSIDDLEIFMWCLCALTEAQLKVVVFSDADYERAAEIAQRMPGIPMVLQPGYDTETKSFPFPVARLAERFAADRRFRPSARLLPQLHRILWGDARGV
jgi:7-carboxy-7-deazaguanine synthase